MEFVTDTTLLVGLWRRQPWAVSFARKHPEAVFHLPWVVLGEFRHGALRAGHDPGLVEEFLNLGVPFLDPAPVIPVYARICAGAQDAPFYRAIGQNDLWIAAAALAMGLPLVSRNRRHFDGIDGIDLKALEA